MLTPKEQIEIIKKGADAFVHEEELLRKLEKSYKEKKPLIVKLGLDPSAPDIHLGHAVVLRKAKQIQDLGHRAVIVIGDFTGRIGDPTGKTKGRKALDDGRVKENAKTYCEQIFKVLDRQKTEVRFNSEWLSGLTFENVIQLAATTTVARMMERDDFKTRFQNQNPIGIHEFFYPLMQAYDSVELKADIELGGTDQTFNVLMGRALQKFYNQEQQIAIFMPILEGLDGKEKMSKSLGNYIGVNEPSEVMFKKTMEIPDRLIIRYFELATDEHPQKIEMIKELLKRGINPRDIKLQLAGIITRLYHGHEKAEEAGKYFEAAFVRREIPADVPELLLDPDKDTVNDAISQFVTLGLVASKSDFLRLIKQGGVRIDGEKLLDDDRNRVLIHNEVMRIGKKKFIRFIK